MAFKDHVIVSQQKWLTVPFVHKIGKTRQHSSANHDRLAIIVYNIGYSALYYATWADQIAMV